MAEGPAEVKPQLRTLELKEVEIQKLSIGDDQAHAQCTTH